MLEESERWLSELSQRVRTQDLITNSGSYMPLPEIVQEVREACAEPRPHEYLQAWDWASRAADLMDALQLLGPRCQQLIDVATRALHTEITSELLSFGSTGKPNLDDDSKRASVAVKADTLDQLLGTGDVLVAAWRDLVDGSKSLDYEEFSDARVAFLRDSVVAFSRRRRQDTGYFSPLALAAGVMARDSSSVWEAKWMLGDRTQLGGPPLDERKADIDDAETDSLAAQVLVSKPRTGTFVVWFRFSPAFVRNRSCVSHGDVTFYDSYALASALCDHDRARQKLAVVPEELLTEKIRERQLSGEVDDHQGFKPNPRLVYSRVVVRDVERHRAVETAQMHLEAVIETVGVHPNMWKLLGGTLLFDADREDIIPPDWGLKEPLPTPVFYENDRFTRDLQELAGSGVIIDADTARQLKPILRLQTELRSAPDDDPAAVVMAAVRAIEHCNSIVAPTAKMKWYEFINEFLIDEYVVSMFGRRVVSDVFSAVLKYNPNSYGSPRPPELIQMKKDIAVEGQHNTYDMTKAPGYVSALVQVYDDHWLWRRLVETEHILSSGLTLGAEFSEERRRADTLTKRLTRSRNAAVHGGVLSEPACTTTMSFASTLARQVLGIVIRAITTKQSVETYALQQRDEFKERSRRLQLGGDPANLFHLVP
ncbi:hypothetical protein GCWB2_24235 (plasmid) [Gordonia rubripertincta]|nr:hypothetical protein GCWB2_24235 [Gordonia rubripertincta]